jgi:hypothetical protein
MTVTASATQLKPTQKAARQMACIKKNGTTRNQSTPGRVSTSVGREEKSLLPNQRKISRPTRSAPGGEAGGNGPPGDPTWFSGVIGFLKYISPKRVRRMHEA